MQQHFRYFLKLLPRTRLTRVAAIIEKHFLQPGGLITTIETTRQQWDAPNGWAPLQWIAIKD